MQRQPAREGQQRNQCDDGDEDEDGKPGAAPPIRDCAAARTEPLARQHELNEPKHHTQDRQRESPTPAELRRTVRYEQGAEQSTDTDAEIED